MRVNEKKERNELLVQLIDEKKMTYEQVCTYFKFKSRSTVHEIYKREKLGISKYVRRVSKGKRVIHR